MLNSNEIELYTLDYCLISIDQNNIISLRYKAEHIITLSELRYVAELVDEIAKKYDNCYLLSIGSTLTSIESDAREFGEHHNFPVKAEGFVINSLAQKILADFLVRFGKKEYPVKVFYKEPEARKWLLLQ